MDVLANLALGFQTAMSLSNLLYCLVGVFLGTAVGVLPGIGPIATIAMLLPITFGLPPVSALIMLSGIYYGAQYGGSTTAILINLPGESASVVTALDGYRMARQGKAGLALATAAIGSFIAGTAATLLVALFAPPLAEVALRFGPAEYFSLMVLGLVASIVLASGSLLHALAMVVVGLVLGLIGTDVNSGDRPLQLRLPAACRRHRLRRHRHGHVRPGRDRRQSRARGDALRGGHPGEGPAAVARRLAENPRSDRARHGARLGSRHPAGRRRDPGFVCLLFAREEAFEDAGGSSDRAPSKAWPAPKPPTMPARRPRSFRC